MKGVYLSFKPRFFLYANFREASFVYRCLSIAVRNHLQLLWEDLARTELITISYLDSFTLVLSNESSKRFYNIQRNTIVIMKNNTSSPLKIATHCRVVGKF